MELRLPAFFILIHLQHSIIFVLPSDSLYETIFSKFLYESGISKMLALADFYHVSTDYLLCRTELREHTNKSVSDLHLNDDAVQILTDEKYNPRLLSELLSHESFHKFITDLEIYIDGFNDKGIQIANAFLDVMRYKQQTLKEIFSRSKPAKEHRKLKRRNPKL